MQFSAKALCTAPVVWLWLSLMLIQQARGFAVLFQLSDLRTLTLTSFLYQRLTQLSIFREEAETQGRVSRADWQDMPAVHHTHPQTPRMVYPHPQPANGHLQTLTHTCFLCLSPFIPGSMKDRGTEEASCVLTHSSAEENHLPGGIDGPSTTRLSGLTPARSQAQKNTQSLYPLPQKFYPTVHSLG